MAAIHGQVLVDTLCDNAPLTSPHPHRLVTQIIKRSARITQALKSWPFVGRNSEESLEKKSLFKRGSIRETVCLRNEVSNMGYCGPSSGIRRWPSKQCPSGILRMKQRYLGGKAVHPIRSLSKSRGSSFLPQRKPNDHFYDSVPYMALMLSCPSFLQPNASRRSRDWFPIRPTRLQRQHIARFRHHPALSQPSLIAPQNPSPSVAVLA